MEEVDLMHVWLVSAVKVVCICWWLVADAYFDPRDDVFWR